MNQMAKATERDGRVALANDLIRLEFDLHDHGALVSVVDVVTGTDLVRDPAAPRLLWRLELRHGGSPEVERVLSSAAGDVSWAAARTAGGRHGPGAHPARVWDGRVHDGWGRQTGDRQGPGGH